MARAPVTDLDRVSAAWSVGQALTIRGPPPAAFEYDREAGSVPAVDAAPAADDAVIDRRGGKGRCDATDVIHHDADSGAVGDDVGLHHGTRAHENKPALVTQGSSVGQYTDPIADDAVRRHGGVFDLDAVEYARQALVADDYIGFQGIGGPVEVRTDQGVGSSVRDADADSVAGAVVRGYSKRVPPIALLHYGCNSLRLS